MAGARVLIIDDDRLIQAATRMLLTAVGFTVETAGGAREGVAQAQADPPALILLDIMMPDLDGWQGLELLQGDDRTRAIPVVMFTAREHRGGPQLARERGAVDYVQKPYEPEELIAIAKRYTGTA